ncbi:MAG: OmpA family protein, partial [Bradymonadaceae bacterium]
AVGLFDRIELGATVPFVSYQQTRSPGLGLGSTASSGLGRSEVYGAVEIVPHERSPVAVAAVVSGLLPASPSHSYLGPSTPGGGSSLRVTGDIGPMRLTADLGATLQSETAVGSTSIGHRLDAAAGVEYSPDPSWGLGAAFESATRLTAPLQAPDVSRGELLLGGRYRPLDWLELSGALGRGVVRGVGAPDLRAVVSIAYRRRPQPSGGPCEYQGTSPPSELTPADCPDRDFDGDGVVNSEDKCPETAEDVDGFRDSDGCPDSDNDKDGEADRRDPCPNHPEDDDGFLDQDGCPDLDNDGDGILDDRDQCAEATEDFDGVRGRDGCPDPDNDNDSILDTRDRCPRRAGPASNRGCPVPGAPEATVTEERIEISEKLYFFTARAILRPQSHAVLEKVGQALRKNPEIRRVEIRGYADRRGASQYNQRLSWERAKVVRLYLIHRAGIAPDRLEATGYGEVRSTSPDESADSARTADGNDADREKQFARARRVEFKILERQPVDDESN